MERTAVPIRRTVPRTRRHYDFTLMFLVIFACTVGLIIIYSSSAYIAQSKGLSSTHFLFRQGLSVLLGILGMIFFSMVNYKIFLLKLPLIRIRIATFIFLVANILQFYVSYLVKDDRNGSVRWINIGPISFQPSEISKLAVILFVAAVCSRIPKRMRKVGGFFQIGVYVAPIIAFIAKENLSTAIIVGVIFVSVCFVTSTRYWYYFLAAAAGVAGSIAYVLLNKGYRSERITAWLNLEGSEKGHQILQGLYAISSGGILGTGLGGSVQKFGRVPEAYNDMVFTIICEELGLAGGIAVIILFILILMRMFSIALNAKDLFGSLITVGIMTQIAIQVILNVAVVTNFVPATGITLPFISYGGTSVAILLSEIGIVLNISSKIEYRDMLEEV